MPTRSEEPSVGGERSGLGGHRGHFTLLKTFPAKHRAALCGLERNGGFLLASGADCLGFHALVVAPVLRQAKRLGALAFAILASFGLVLELLVVEEELLA